MELLQPTEPKIDTDGKNGEPVKRAKMVKLVNG